ncbi:MAG: sulfotransferase family protein [Parvibaculum sp.]|uniref:sulfotransferase family 2 domain-containing protein n=1 Tax=Parvibaculum sp. TaxID=2024848 RepID=UPI0025FE0F8A|nr:sulfotransferase family 2 domain-containing protein [Parvibaculum sp.]MCE9648247.1 sulfotransferase family protein [Parvibaculum sp.]
MTIHANVKNLGRRTGYRLKRLKEKLSGDVERPRVIFIHTPKTGGMSVNSYFKEHVGSKRSGRVVRYDDFGSHELEAFLTRAREAKFVTGHMPWEAFVQCRDDNTFGFAILRDPYERLRSLYHFTVNLPPSYERAAEVNDMQRMSLREFLSSKDKRVRFHTDNYLARQFSGSIGTLAGSPDERRRLAERAIENLSSLDLVGFNDDLDAAFAEAARAAGLPPPPPGRRLNVTANLASAARRADAVKALDEEMRALAAPLVGADMMVYQHFMGLREATATKSA